MHTLSKPMYALAICLSALAGCVDAIGFLYLGRYFISFMSGNSTQFAVNLISGNVPGITLLGGIIALFVTGTMLGVWARHFSKPHVQTVNVLALVTALLTAAAVSHALGCGFLPIALMTLAMGAENAVFQRNGEVVVGLTYMTGALVKLGQRLANAALGGSKFAWVPYLLLWLGLLCGGAAGTLLFFTLGLDSLWVAVAWAGALTILTWAFRDTLAT